MKTQNNVCFLAIAKDMNRAATSIDTLANGEVALFDLNGNLLEASTTATQFVIAQGRATGVPFISPVINKTGLTGTVKKYSAASEQTTYIGYNGTSGDIVDIDDNVYLVRFYFNEIDAQGFNQQRVKHFEYKSGNLTSGDASDVALGIAASVAANFKREKYGRTTDGDNEVLASAVCNQALAAGYDFDGTLTVVKGSNSATVTSSGTYNTGTALAVGDVVRIGATATGAVSLTSDCYKVTNISGSTTKTITFDRPVKVASGARVTGSSYNQVVPAASVATASWGVKLVGNDRKWEVGKSTFSKVRFDVSLLNFGTTPITTTAVATEGVGTYRSVSELEQFLQGNEFSYLYRSNPGGPLLVTPYNDADSATNYDMISLKFYEDVQTGFGAPNRMLKELIIAVDIATAPNAQAEDGTSGFVVVLDDIMGTNLQGSLT